MIHMNFKTYEFKNYEYYEVYRQVGGGLRPRPASGGRACGLRPPAAAGLRPARLRRASPAAKPLKTTKSNPYRSRKIAGY